MNAGAKFWTIMAAIGAVVILIFGFATISFFSGMAVYATHSPGGSGTGWLMPVTFLISILPSIGLGVVLVNRLAVGRNRKLVFGFGWLLVGVGAVAVAMVTIKSGLDLLVLGGAMIFPVGLAGLLISLRKPNS